jgi:cell division protein FtsB
MLYCRYRVSKPLTPAQRRRPARRSSHGRQLAQWAVVFLAGAIIIDAVVGERGLFATWRASDQYVAAALALDQLRTRNDRLREEIRRLTDDPTAIEELARGELGLMKPGEKVFIIKDLKTQDGH